MPPFDIAVTHVMEPVLPGAYAVATVGGMSDDTVVYAYPIADLPAGYLGDIGGVGEAITLKIAQRTGECVTLDIPAAPYGLLALSTSATFGADAWLANRPRLDWVHPAQAVIGEPFRLFGRNLVSVEQYPTTDPEDPTSYGELLVDVMGVTARKRGASDFIDLPVIVANAYEARVYIPDDLTPGEYELFAHNGHGGPLGWSDPITVEVAIADPWPDTVFAVEAYLQRYSNFDDAVAAALRDIDDNGGGVLLFDARTYQPTRTIVVPPRTVLRGAGMERTRLQLPAQGAVQPPYVAITGDRDFVVEDMSLWSVYAAVLVCAPTLVPESFDGGLMHVCPLVPRHARNVTVRRVQMRQPILNHCDRRPDKEHVERMKAYVLSQGMEFGGFRGIAFKGDGLTVEECEIYGGGTCIYCNRSSQVRVSHNVLKAGPAGFCLDLYSRLLWPDGHPEHSQGAKVAGSFCHEMILEDNDMSAYSERARGLVGLHYAGQNIYFARNDVHDIQATYDAEAVLAHLWQARWSEPTITMLSPTTARINDPTGEVTHEWLEGAYLDIVDGRGIGQVRKIIRREGNLLEIERPWRVDPDASSDVVFTAPPPFMNLVFLDNAIVTEAVNLILWGTLYDTVVDGNYTADSPGLTLWTIRLADDQKVWGGLGFTSVINNVMDRGWSSPRTAADTLNGAVGFATFGTKESTGDPEGYDFLGVVVRNNHATNNTGIGFRATFDKSVPGGPTQPWTVHHAGVVIEANHCTYSTVGIALEDDTNVVERGNTFHEVEFPLTWVKKR